MNIGERVGDYEIVAVLGAGGMGQVFKVRNILSDRIEAMKVLLPNLAASGAGTDVADRFLREIKVQAALDHPNIARLHTAQISGNQLVMIMEFVDGESIEKLLSNGPISLRESINYAGQVLDALAYAHSRGVVHRDIKPANIMVTPGGAVKLMDFGIARMKSDPRLTQAGHTVGSLYYMSPEQIQGAEPDPRSDIYSLGITLYQMVTGRRPFQGDSDYSIMAAHLQQAPIAPIEIVPGVPPAVSDVILMAIAKDPAARFQSAEAFGAALKNSAGFSQPVFSQPVAPPPVVAAPPPMPYASPAAMPPPPMPPITAPKSNRGLYMVLGSLATLAILAAAIVEGPKFFGAKAGAKPDEAQQSPIAAPASAIDTPAQAPVQATTPPVESAPAAPPAAQPVQQPVPQSTPTPQRSVAARPAPAQAQQQPAVQTSPVQAQQPPQQQFQQPPAQQPQQAAPVQSAPPQAPAGPDLTQLNALRKDYNLLSVKASTAKGGLRSLEQQMARQGLGLRGDIREAEGRLDLQMREAMDDIQSGNIEEARQNLQYAQQALSQIEKFLGR